MVRFDPSKGSFQWYFNQKEQKDAALKQVKSITEGDISNFYSSSEAAKNIVTNIERIVKTELPPEVKRAYRIDFIISQAMTIDEITKRALQDHRYWTYCSTSLLNEAEEYNFV